MNRFMIMNNRTKSHDFVFTLFYQSLEFRKYFNFVSPTHIPMKGSVTVKEGT